VNAKYKTVWTTSISCGHLSCRYGHIILRDGDVDRRLVCGYERDEACEDCWHYGKNGGEYTLCLDGKPPWWAENCDL
jgi:hypothetical protein